MRRNSAVLPGLRIVLGWALLLATPGLVRGRDAAPKATISVSGLGWWGNREQRSSLERLVGTERGSTLDANAIEDAVFLLMSALIEEGFNKPTIQARVTANDGRRLDFTFDAKLETSLPRPLAATRVEFRVERGVSYRVRTVQFAGLSVVPVETARRYFIGEDVLIGGGAARRYSPARLKQAADALETDLRRRGYADANVHLASVRVDDRSGQVDADVIVTEGVRWEVRQLQVAGASAETVPDLKRFVGQPWSQFWQQDVVVAVRNHYYRLGHPDVRARLQPTLAPEEKGVRPVDVVAQVELGPAVRVGNVRFEGAVKTNPEVLRRRVRVATGDPLNVLALDQARFRLGRLGVFDAVDLRYEPADGLVRDPVFVVREGREQEANLLLGYGSYEQLRGGVEWRQFNLFGRAHQSRLLLVQSMKSSRGEMSYTVPELFGETVDGTGKLFGLQRQETSFLRQEYGGNFSLSAPVHALGANATLGYTYQALRNRDNQLETRAEDSQQETAASVEFNLSRDRRDNPLRPRRGYRWFLQTETASRYFGGTVDYQRLELGISDHVSWGSGRWFHFGLNHGVVTTYGGTETELPVNKRFFPGGDASIRGYQVGEAAPLGPDGKYVGALSYILANIELEQALTTKWSAIVFADALGTASRLQDYPCSEGLYTLGLGVRYQTLIGPLRLEYGHNLNPRPIDPSGTLLFSVGFPF